jgi:hypothetical protein
MQHLDSQKGHQSHALLIRNIPILKTVHHAVTAGVTAGLEVKDTIPRECGD